MVKKRLLVLTAIIFITILVPFLPKAKTVLSLKKLDDTPLYQLTYQSDYGLDRFLKKGIEGGVKKSLRRTLFPILGNALSQRSGGSEANGALPGTSHACTTVFTSNSAGEKLVGKNFDYLYKEILVLETHPRGHYRSIGMCEMGFLGYLPSYTPDSIFHRMNLLYAPYETADGMNEKGVAVSLMALPASFRQKPDASKIKMESSHALRAILDYAADVDQAIALLRGYCIEPTIMCIHLLIADRSGRSVVVEYVDGAMKIVEKDGIFQISTNFSLFGADEEARKRTCDRYRRASETLSAAKGDLDANGTMRLMRSVSNSTTMWSVVYNLSKLEMEIVPHRAWDRPYHFILTPSVP